MVVIGDSLLIVITELGFSFHSFIIQDNEKFSFILRLTSTLSVCSFLCFISLLNRRIIGNIEGAEEITVIAIYFFFTSTRWQPGDD